MAQRSSLLLDPIRQLIDRDLSWLQFNERVLHEAQDDSNPLLERLRFLGITSSNLDEFFMIRFASISRELSSVARNPKKSKNRAQRLNEIRDEILKAVKQFSAKQTRTLEHICQALAEDQIYLTRNLTPADEFFEKARALFYDRVLPELGVPRFFEANLLRDVRNLQVSVLLKDNTFVPIPKQLPAILWERTGSKQLIAFFLDDLLNTFLAPALGDESTPLIFRVTRDADVRVELEYEDPESIPDLVRQRIGTREKRKPLRLQVVDANTKVAYSEILHSLRLPNDQVFSVGHPLFLHGCIPFVSEIEDLLPRKKQLFFPSFSPCIPAPFDSPGRIFAGLEERDYFFHHPYDSFQGFVNFMAEAVADPNVTSIEQTVYRVDALSEVTELLKDAARREIFTRVVIEPRARFDEINNIQLAEELRSAGVHVVFAAGNLKMHAKVALVTRKTENGTQTFTHLSTGNYNAKTARRYTDMAILTSNPGFGADARRFFDSVSAGALPDGMQFLALAPTGLHRRILSLIKAETAAAEKGEKARIFAKVNALVDPKVVEALYAASQAGVRVDLVVRGACSLIPGIAGLSENISVISIVDRFLEHSRIYYFENQEQMYLSSADWMPRNFFSRLEIAFPIVDANILEFMTSVVIPTYLNDREKARSLTKQGIWRKRTTAGKQHTRSQYCFKELARRKYRGTSLEFR